MLPTFCSFESLIPVNIQTILISSLPLSLTEFISSNQSFSQDISTIISKLKEDKDRDVRYFSGNYDEVNNNPGTPLSPSTPSSQYFENNKQDTEHKLDIASKRERGGEIGRVCVNLNVHVHVL